MIHNRTINDFNSWWHLKSVTGTIAQNNIGSNTSLCCDRASKRQWAATRYKLAGPSSITPRISPAFRINLKMQQPAVALANDTVYRIKNFGTNQWIFYDRSNYGPDAGLTTRQWGEFQEQKIVVTTVIGNNQYRLQFMNLRGEGGYLTADIINDRAVVDSERRALNIFTIQPVNGAVGLFRILTPRQIIYSSNVGGVNQVAVRNVNTSARPGRADNDCWEFYHEEVRNDQ
jgi:hypothetical protein